MENRKGLFTVQSAMQFGARYSLGFMLIIGTATFLSLTIFKTDYYLDLFDSRWGSTAHWLAWVMAVGVSSITEALRLGLLVASARDFSLKNVIGGWLGLIGSVALTFYDWQISDTVAQIWEARHLSITNMFRFLVLAGLLIELRLILMLFGGLEESEKEVERESKTTKREPVPEPLPEEFQILGLD
jgi:hypothetical protein